MLPPIDDMISISSVESAPSCARVWHALASSMPNAATAKAVHKPITTKPGDVAEEVELEHRPCPQKHHHQLQKASSVLNASFPASSLVMVTRELSTRSSVPLSASSSSDPAEPLAVNSRNITPIAAA